MGVSAHAFRLQISEVGICPSSPNAMCGRKTSDRALAAVPIEWMTVQAGLAGTSQAEHAVHVVEEVLDRGLPVLAIGEETDLVLGHFHDHLVARTADSTEEGYSALTRWPSAFMLPEKRHAPIPPALQIREGLEVAIQDWKSEGTVNGYFSGAAAYRNWRGKLQEEVITSLSVDARWRFQHGNAYITECLMDARRTAAAFLRRVQNMLGPTAKEHLLAAAELYDKLTHEDLTSADFAHYAPYSWMCDEEHVWDEAMRQDQIARLVRAEEKDRLAIEELSRAIAINKVAV